MLESRLCLICALVTTSSLEFEVLSLLRLLLEARVPKEDKARGAEAHPLSTLDILDLLPRGAGDRGVEGEEEQVEFIGNGSLNSVGRMLCCTCCTCCACCTADSLENVLNPTLLGRL